VDVTERVNVCRDLDRVAIEAGLLIAYRVLLLPSWSALFFALSFLHSPVASHTSFQSFLCRSL
jgi:hypothetical protein